MTHLRALGAISLLMTLSCGTPQETIKEAAPPETTVVATASATAAPSASAAPKANVKTMFVNDQIVDCEGGNGPRKCMQVRESESAEWELFYDNIEGFTYEKGYAYELRVEVKEVANPMADASSLSHELVEIVSKTKAAP